MAAGPCLDHAASLLLPLASETAIGLHATLNSEWTRGVRWRPVLPPNEVPTLVDENGVFHPCPAILHARGFALNELMAELAAQLARLRAAGLSPVYIDTHMNFDWLGHVKPALAAFAAAENLVFDSAESHPRLPTCGMSLFERIAAAGGGPHVLVTHPGKTGGRMGEFVGETTPPGKIETDRDAERTALCDPALLQRVADGSLNLARYAPPFS
jgi:hypothetical protein